MFRDPFAPLGIRFLSGPRPDKKLIAGVGVRRFAGARGLAHGEFIGG